SNGSSTSTRQTVRLPPRDKRFVYLHATNARSDSQSRCCGRTRPMLSFIVSPCPFSPLPIRVPRQKTGSIGCRRARRPD
ncbi:hypothetical protein LSAT2_007799, partial [Lamellibrachia satsuma]